MITRIRELLEARQLSPTQFADLIGVGRPVISHILSERNKPSLEVVQKIIGAFPDISLPWLLAGTGPMLAAATAGPPTVFPDSVAEVAPAPTAAAPTVWVAAAPPAPPVAQPAAFVRPPVVSSPGNYPQPPRFRPGTTVAAPPASAASSSRANERVLATAPAPAEAPASLPDVPATTNAAAAATYPSAAPPPTPAAPAPVAPAQAPLLATPAASPSPTATGNLGSLALPTAEATPSASPDLAAPHPAAALSFLGEPGKAIRRIVIFYRDGSFSDYQPEGS
jgi:transcriptional regulator with XRE-family HTH domain